jgi:hypothetical protein
MRRQSKFILNKAIEHLDITLATIGCILSIPLILYIQLANLPPIYITAGVISFLGCLAYLLIRRKSLASAQTQIEATPRVYLLLNILFFCLLIYSIIGLYLRPELYTRPLSYFIATAAMAAILAIEILFLPPRKSATYFALFKIIIIGLSLEWAQLLIYPSIVGMDPWYHEMFTTKILAAGYIPVGYGYSRLPCFHLMIGATSLVTGLGYKLATMFSVCLLQVACDTLFIFLLGKFIHSTKIGLLAALLLGVANWHILFGYWTIPNTIAVVFIPIIIYLLFKLRQEKPKASICLSALFMAVLILTHTIGALCLAMLLFLIWLGFEIYKRLRYQAATTARIFLVAFILFTGATLSYWTFVSGTIHTFVSLFQTGFSGEYFGILPPGETLPPEVYGALQIAIAQYRNNVPFLEQLFNNLGLFLFFALSFIGCFAMLSKIMRNRYSFALVVGGLTILVINFFGIITYRGFLSDRWNYFSQILLAIPVGVAVFWLGGLPAKKIANACLIGVMTFVLSLLMIMSPQANLDNRTFSPNTIVRFAFFESELQGVETVSRLWNGKIGSDGYVECLGFLPPLDNRIKDIGQELYTRDFNASKDAFILVREEIVQHPFKLHSYGIYRLDYVPSQALREQGFSKVYDNGSVSGFISLK